MQGKLAVIKNIIWAIGIAVCLLALVVGLIAASAVRYDGSGQIQRPTDASPTAPAVNVPTNSGTLMSLGDTADGGQGYIDALTFLCDSALIGLRDYGILSGGIATTQVWGSSAGNIPASSIADCTIKYPGDGSNMSASGAAMASQPSTLVISLGTDSLADTTQEDFITNYASLINAIRAASPGTKIICCSVTSVTSGYSGIDGLSVSLISSANEWIRQVCTENGVYYADVASAVCDTSGTLFSEYASSNGKTLNSAGLNEILLYLRTHTA